MMIVQRTFSTLRAVAVALGLVRLVGGQPTLTTIQDVLYKADGARFNGTAVVTWNSFEAADRSNISMHSFTVRITDGNLRVQLVPSTTATPPAFYAVKYNSDGKIQFDERWAVPPSALPLRVRDVRVSSVAPLEPGDTPLQETDIVGLSAALALRPTKSPGYAPGRAVFVNSTGALESVSGSLTDCVRVDGSAGPCGLTDGGLPSFIDSEVPGGITDGANVLFTLSMEPNPSSSVTLFRNGIRQKPTQDYTMAANTVHFVPAAAPQPGDTLLVSYRVTGSTSSMGSMDSMSSSAVSTAPATLCVGGGSATSSTTVGSLGSCTIPADALRMGDRVEIRFDYAHDGTASGFMFEVLWGGTVLVQRAANLADSMITGRGDAVIHSAGAQLSGQSWGTSLPAASTLVNASDSLTAPLVIDFRGAMTEPGDDTLTLRNFTVVRYP
jgi:hypothetical protein